MEEVLLWSKYSPTSKKTLELAENMQLRIPLLCIDNQYVRSYIIKNPNIKKMPCLYQRNDLEYRYIQGMDVIHYLRNINKGQSLKKMWDNQGVQNYNPYNLQQNNMTNELNPLKLAPQENKYLERNVSEDKKRELSHQRPQPSSNISSIRKDILHIKHGDNKEMMSDIKKQDGLSKTDYKLEFLKLKEQMQPGNINDYDNEISEEEPTDLMSMHKKLHRDPPKIEIDSDEKEKRMNVVKNMLDGENYHIPTKGGSNDAAQQMANERESFEKETYPDLDRMQ
jgi:hypothetical protein